MRPGIDFPGIAVTFFCHDGNGRFAMQRRGEQSRDEQGKWDFGGGRVETHDAVEDTVRKEVLEEYCAEAMDVEFLGHRDVHREHQGLRTHWIALDFKVRINPLQAKIGEPHKFTDLKWFTLSSLPAADEMHSELPRYFSLYEGKLL